MTWKIILVTSVVWLCFGTAFLYIRETVEMQVILRPKENNSLTATSFFSIFNGFNTYPDIASATTMHDNSTISTTKRFRHNQARWAYKLDFMDGPETIPDDKRICFVHVGKTAGSTLACYFGFDYGQCLTGSNSTYSLFRANPNSKIYKAEMNRIVQQMIPEGNLSRYTTSMMHREADSCKEDAPINAYLFVVRNPFTRIQSWFEYERPNKYDNIDGQLYQKKKPLFVDCNFTSLNQLGGKKGLAAYNDTLCSRRAWRAITGEIGYTAHNKFNYGYYYKNVLRQQSNPRIIVIRTEHLENDWSSIETKILNGPSLPSNFQFTHKNKSPKLIEDLIFDDYSKNNICHALCEEIQIYKHILQRAENLDKADYAQSIQELIDTCPNEARSDYCSSNRY